MSVRKQRFCIWAGCYWLRRHDRDANRSQLGLLELRDWLRASRGRIGLRAAGGWFSPARWRFVFWRRPWLWSRRWAWAGWVLGWETCVHYGGLGPLLSYDNRRFLDFRC